MPISSSARGPSRILVATEAAGEGINLQVCNILFNYDIPWNWDGFTVMVSARTV